MHTGEREPARSNATTGAKNQVNAERTPGTPASSDREPAFRGESKRPWAVRQTNGPTWAEKVEQF